MAIQKVVVVDGNNLIVRIDRGVAGRGVTDVVPVEIDNSLYLEFYFSDGTTETVGPVGTIQYLGQSPIVVTGSTISLSTVPVNLGGTGATTASGARTNLGLGTISTQDASAVAITGGSITGITDLAIADGGTGASTASGARTNLGLGTIATQDSSNVSITGGSITGITDLAIADGGTGASTASGARSNLGLGTAATLDAGVANGVATLDSGGTVPLSQIPASIQGGVSYQGTWNALTNTPTLSSGVGSKGYYYVVSVAGNTNLDGITSWNVGDWAIYSGTAWQKIDNTDAVTSVNGYTGTVVLTNTDISGFGTMSTQNANNVSITGGSISGITDLAVADGGTGASTASGARTNLGAAASGANSDITSMSGITGGISTVDYVGFDTTYTTALTAGQLGWDGNNTLGLGMAGGNVIQKIGEDQFYYVKASSAITKGQVVMFTGSVGASGVVTGAPAASVTDGSYIMGIAAESIAVNGFGLIQFEGTLRGFDTSAFTDGDILWYNPSVTGGLTATKPSAPYIKVQMCAVINAGNAGNGSVLIRVSPGSVLGGTDSNVQFGTLANGNLIQYDSTLQYWKNVAPSTVAVTTFSGGTTGLTPSTATAGAVTLAGTLGIANGGTGQTTANAAFNALAPDQTGNSGKYLTTDGSNTSWATNPLGTVTSVSGTGTVSGISLSGTVTTSGSLTLGGLLDLSAPPAIGGTTPAAGAFTTLSASSDLTLSGGTANGVLYLNGSKVATSGSALTFDGTNLGVSQSSPSTFNGKLTVGNGGTSEGITIYAGATGVSNGALYFAKGTTGIQTYAGYVAYFGADDSMRFAVAASEAMRLTSTGLGIGTSSPLLSSSGRGNVTINGSASSILAFGIGGTNSSYIYSASDRLEIDAASTRWMQFNTNGNERMRLDSSGNLLVGTTSNPGILNKSVVVDSGASNLVGFVMQNDTTGRTSSDGGAMLMVGAEMRLTNYENNAMLFSTNGSERARIDSAGNFVIGSTFAVAKLDVRGKGYFETSTNPTNGAVLTLTNQTTTSNNGAKLVLDAYNIGTVAIGVPTNDSAIAFYCGPTTERARIDSSGNFGIGTSSPGQKLDVTGGIRASSTIQLNNSSGGDITNVSGSTTFRFGIGTYDGSGLPTIGTDGAQPIRFFTNATERARIDSSGTLCVNTTNPAPGSGAIQVAPKNSVGLGADASAAYYSVANYYNGSFAGGLYVTTGATALITSSDYRLKNTIQPMSDALAKVAQLKPVTYKWNSDGSDGEGFIAHELAEIFPKAVIGEKDAVDENGNPKYQGIDKLALVATLTAAIQEQQAQIESLRKRLADAGIA